jgi:catechol 2,3-dioxygenase
MSAVSVTPASDTARLPADTRIGRVRLRVADLERSIAFYQDVLGLGVARHGPSELALTAGPGTSAGREKLPRELIVLEESPGIQRRPPRPTSSGLYHVAFLLPSRAELGRTLLGLHHAGYPLRGMSDHAVSESLYLDDPDGNGLEIYADRPRALWPVRDGVVQLTVDPMDVEGVLSAAQPAPDRWPGLPPETIIGHLHFTVSNLERSVVFYRDVVGFDQMMRIPSLAAVSAGGYHHHLNLNTWAGEGTPADSPQMAGLVGWELLVPGADARQALAERLGRAGAARPGGALDPDSIQMEIGSPS